MIAGFPKWLVVGAAILGGTLLLMIFRPPHRLCTSKVEMLQELEKGRLFPGKGKTMERSPRVLREIEMCKLGNSPGACFELFSTMRRLVHDLQDFPLECAEDLHDVKEVRNSLKETLTLLTQIAWGEVPPEKGVGAVRQGWLESSDIALFCNLKDLYVRFFTKEEFDEMRDGIYAKLSGEAAVFTNGECVNCDFRKTALQALPPEEIWSRSLFSVRCELFR